MNRFLMVGFFLWLPGIEEFSVTEAILGYENFALFMVNPVQSLQHLER